MNVDPAEAIIPNHSVLQGSQHGTAFPHPVQLPCDICSLYSVRVPRSLRGVIMKITTIGQSLQNASRTQTLHYNTLEVLESTSGITCNIVWTDFRSMKRNSK